MAPFIYLLLNLNLGLYECTTGNNPDICDQRVEKIFHHGEQITAIKISYVGYCGDQGPYTYYCDEGVCSDQFIRITLLNSNQYLWENTGYGFKCEMKSPSSI